MQNHLLPDQAGEFARRGIVDRDLQLRSMIVRKLKPLAIECVARGYLIGSGWSAYQKSGAVCGNPLPAGLRQADRLPEPIFTPTTKAPKGQHDEPINDAQAAAIVGAALYAKVKSTSLALYRFGHDRARQAGMILADTKFEFGTDSTGNLFLIDEVLTRTRRVTGLPTIMHRTSHRRATTSNSCGIICSPSSGTRNRRRRVCRPT
jgi:phosphoribosylaminoimidazole-succinocarboxamide synthase